MVVLQRLIRRAGVARYWDIWIWRDEGVIFEARHCAVVWLPCKNPHSFEKRGERHVELDCKVGAGGDPRDGDIERIDAQVGKWRHGW